MTDVDLDDVRVALEVVVPHVVEDLTLRHDVALAPKQELEQRELARREIDLGIAAPHSLGRRIEAEVARLEHRRAFGGAAPDQRPQPRDEDRVRERLGQVVVGAGVERFDLVPLALSWP